MRQVWTRAGVWAQRASLADEEAYILETIPEGPKRTKALEDLAAEHAALDVQVEQGE